MYRLLMYHYCSFYIRPQEEIIFSVYIAQVCDPVCDFDDSQWNRISHRLPKKQTRTTGWDLTQDSDLFLSHIKPKETFQPHAHRQLTSRLYFRYKIHLNGVYPRRTFAHIYHEWSSA